MKRVKANVQSWGYECGVRRRQVSRQADKPVAWPVASNTTACREYKMNDDDDLDNENIEDISGRARASIVFLEGLFVFLLGCQGPLSFDMLPTSSGSAASPGTTFRHL